MFANTFLSIKATVLMMLVVGAFVMGAFFIATPVASAQVGPNTTNATTLAQLQALVNSLIAQLQALQAGTGTTTPPVVPPVLPPVVTGSTTIPLGSSIVTSDSLRVRGEPGVNSAFIEVKPAGSRGVVVEGPIRRDSHYWYKVDYETGADGWNAGGWLRLRTDLADVLGTYVGFKDGVQFIKTENINRLDALANCKLNISTNPGTVIRCVWKGIEIMVSTDVKDTPRINNALLPVNSSEVTVNAVYAVPGVGTTSSSTNVGKINWGDGSADETVYAKVTSGLANPKIKHKYARNGRFTITVIGLDGKTDVETVAVTKTDIASTTFASITSFTATPNRVGVAKNGQQDVVLNWTSVGTTLCSIYVNGTDTSGTKLMGDLATSGAYTVKPMWSTSSTPVPKEYFVRCADAVKDLFVEKSVRVSLVGTTTPPIATTTPSTTPTLSRVAPNKNVFGCNRSVATKLASGTIACFGMWDYGDDFGGDKNMCEANSSPTTGCTIQTPVCSSGVAKATAYRDISKMTDAQVTNISNRLRVIPAVTKAHVAGVWEYKCSGAVSTSTVLGASTDIFSEIANTLSAIRALIGK